MKRSYRRHRNPQKNEKNEQPFFFSMHEQPHPAQPFFASSGIQKKELTVGKPGDKYEQEADAMADTVVNQSSGTPAIHKKEISTIQRESLATPLEDERLGTAEQRMEEDKLVQEKPELQRMGEKEEEEMPVQEMQEKEEEPEMQMQEEEEEESPVQTEGETGGRANSPSLTHTIKQKAGGGKPLSGKTQTEMETAFGMDFSGVNIHTDEEAVKMNKGLHAQAFTHGKDIYFNTGKYNPDTQEGKHLLAHELTHVVQQNGQMHSVNNSIQRRLFVSGANNANVNEYLNLIGGAAGFTLRWLFSNPRVRITGNTPAGPTSASSRRNLRQVINDPAQHAEIFVGTHQPGVSIGAFPGAGNTVQNVDIDDIRNLNASLPGQGTAKAFHELMENYHSHAPGGPGFGPSHQTGIEAESDLLEESGIAGRRLNRASSRTNIPDFIASMLGLPTGPNISYHLNTQEFTHYFLVMIRRVTATPAGNDFEMVGAFRVPKIQVSQRTVDSFVTGSDAIPAAGNATLNATLAELNANANATILIEGFTDSVGREANNRRLSLRRARSVQAFFIANGINANRISIVGRGETNFVAPNNTEAGRGRNRRIMMTVHRPAI